MESGLVAGIFLELINKTMNIIKTFALLVFICILNLGCFKEKMSEAEKRKIQICTQMPLKEGKKQPGHEAGTIRSKMWVWDSNEERILKICFKDGDAELIKRVMLKAREWEPIAKIKFELVGYYDQPDIKISFLGVGCWSFIGNDAINEKTSMNLGWIDNKTSDAELSRVVLHEFGHVLGLVHEHCLVDGNPIEWKKDKVYGFYRAEPNKWSDEEIDENIFKRYENTELIGGVYDPTSIMIYGIPKELLESGKEIKWNQTISKGDKKVINDAYN